MKVSELIKELTQWLVDNGDDAEVFVTTYDMPQTSGVTSAVTELSDPGSFCCFIRGTQHRTETAET